MADDSDAQEKTQDPTAKRLEKALQDGQVLTSKELFVFATLFAGLFVYFSVVGTTEFWLKHLPHLKI